MIKKSFFSFKNAFSGLKWVFTTQNNFRIHLLLSLTVILGGLIFKISYEEFLIILILIAVGLVIEIVNTAIEETIDALHKSYSEEVKIAKDVSAASMLTFAIIAFIAALIIFIPKIFNFLL